MSCFTVGSPHVWASQWPRMAYNSWEVSSTFSMASRLLIVSFSVCPAPDRHGVQLLNVLKALAGRYQVDVLTIKTGELPFVEKFMKTRMLRVPVGQGALGEQVDAFRR